MPRLKHCSRQTRTVLSLLLTGAPNWCYGYEICKNTGLKSGTLYPILIRLADDGYLETRWEEKHDPGRPPRHLYRLTPSGRALALERSIATTKPQSVQPC